MSKYEYKDYILVHRAHIKENTYKISLRETPKFFIDEKGNKFKKTENTGDGIVAISESRETWYSSISYIALIGSDFANNAITKANQERLVYETRSRLEKNMHKFNYEQSLKFKALLDELEIV